MLRKSLFILLFIPLMTHAQENLSLQDAIAATLKNNYSILIAGNDAAIAKNDNAPGNAGMLPSLDAVAGINQTESNLKQNYTDGRVIDRTNVTNTSTSAGVDLNWTLFDGFKMFVTKSKLAEIDARGMIAYKLEIENTVQQVIAAYFNVTQIQKLIEATKLIIGIDSERVVLAEIRLGVGSGSRLDLLQGKVDLNEQLSILMKQRATLEESKDNLNYLLSRKPGTDFSVSDSIMITYQPSAEALRNSVQQNNFSILAGQRDQRISVLGMKEIKTLHSPVIGFSGGYNYSKTKSEAGFLLLNQSAGYNYGLSLRWNLFDGFNIYRQVKNAKLDVESSGFRLKDLKLQVSTQLEKALRDFDNNISMLTLEQENILLAKENMDVAFERFRSGLSNSIELKNAQSSFQNAESRLVQAQYAAKMSETELMRLNGELVK
ncbi:MAG: TolC family protein [Bacteroidota bacterium]